MTHEIPQETLITGVETTIFDASNNTNITKKVVTFGIAAAVAPALIGCDNSANTNQTPEVVNTPIVEATEDSTFATPLPTEGPVEFTPAPTVKPTPEPATGNVSPEPTASAEPTPELFEIETIVEGDHDAVSFNKAKASLENALEQIPDATKIFPYAIQDLNQCKTGIKKLINEKMKLKSREFACKASVANSFRYYIRTGDVNFYNAAKDIYNYSISKKGLGEDFKATVDAFLAEVGLLKNS